MGYDERGGRSLDLSQVLAFVTEGGHMFAVTQTGKFAFVQEGASVFNQIEQWPIAKSLFFHFFSIYAIYVFVYFINTWIPRLPIVVAIFTGIFIVTYAIVWLTVYLCVRAHAKRLNARL